MFHALCFSLLQGMVIGKVISLACLFKTFHCFQLVAIEDSGLFLEVNPLDAGFLHIRFYNKYFTSFTFYSMLLFGSFLLTFCRKFISRLKVILWIIL